MKGMERSATFGGSVLNEKPGWYTPLTDCPATIIPKAEKAKRICKCASLRSKVREMKWNEARSLGLRRMVASRSAEGREKRGLPARGPTLASSGIRRKDLRKLKA